MAALQLRNGSWRVLFRYRGKQHTYTVGEVDEIEVRATAAKVDYLLMRLKQHLIDLPAGMDIVTCVQFDGKPPDSYHGPSRKEYTFSDLREASGSGRTQASSSHCSSVSSGWRMLMTRCRP